MSETTPSTAPKTAIVVLSDPEGGEEALGRLLNALILTGALRDRDEEVALAFQGAGSRWPERAARPDHPAHALYDAVRDRVSGVSCGCADIFGAAGAEAAGAPLVADLAVPGTRGVQDLSRFLRDGYRLVTF